MSGFKQNVIVLGSPTRTITRINHSAGQRMAPLICGRFIISLLLPPKALASTLYLTELLDPLSSLQN